MARSPLELRVREAARERRRRALVALSAEEQELARVWRDIELRLRSVVRDASERPGAIEDLQRQVRETIRAHGPRRIAAIERAVVQGSLEGLAAGPDVGEAAFESLGRVTPIDAARATEIATEHLFGARAVGGLPLSRRLHAHDEATTRAMSRELGITMRSGASVQATAQRLLEVDDATVYLPRYVRDLRAAVQGGESVRLRATIRRHLASVERLTDPELRAAGRELLRRARTATQADLDRQLRYWVRDRALYQERVVARTETARAHQQAFVESTRGQEWVKGYRWELSPNHPRPDICDVYAQQSIDGLGPGGYLGDSIPALPAHPNCLCFTTAIIDEHHFEREMAAVTGAEPPPEAWKSPTRETGVEWLQRNPELRATILGPGRNGVFGVDPTRVVGPRGEIRPLWQALGRSPPTRVLTRQRVRVAAVDPFGEAGSRRFGPSAPPSPAQPPPEAPEPPPPAPPRARTAEEQRRAMANAVLAPTHDGVRAEARRIIAELHGAAVTSQDVAQGRPHAGELVVMPLKDSRADHSFSGRVRIDRNVWVHARAAARSVLDGSETDLEGRRAWRSIFHEEFHGHSPLEYSAYHHAGQALEEAGVELHAREAVERVLGLPRGAADEFGSYPHFVAHVRSAVRFAGVPADQADDRAREAMRATWRGGTISTAAEYERRFAEALGVQPDQRNRFGRLLRGLP